MEFVDLPDPVTEVDSTKVLKLPQPGHLPIQPVDSYPHSLQKNVTFFLTISKVYHAGLRKADRLMVLNSGKNRRVR